MTFDDDSPIVKTFNDEIFQTFAYYVPFRKHEHFFSNHMKPYKRERWNSLWKERNNICVVCLLCTGCYTFLDKKIPCHVKTLKLSETFFLSNVDNATCFTISHNLPNGFYFEDNRFFFPIPLHSIIHFIVSKPKTQFVSCSFYQ